MHLSNEKLVLQQSTFRASLRQVTYHAEESGYSVARLKVASASDLVTIVGNFPSITAGQTLRLTGFWREHPKYGQQFQVTHAQETKPATLTGLEKYLGSGLIKGVGPVQPNGSWPILAWRPLTIIEAAYRTPHRGCWHCPQTHHHDPIGLGSTEGDQRGHPASCRVTASPPPMPSRFIKQYGDEAIEVVSRNPYQLAADIYGIGFITADTIARNLGIAPDSDARYQAGILHILSQASEDGHCFLPKPELLEHVTQRLALPEFPVDPTRISTLLDHMAETEGTHHRVWLWRPRRPTGLLCSGVLLHGASSRHTSRLPLPELRLP